MTNMVYYRLRVSYVKRGRLSMLSHLEIARALERSIRRANLPFAISQGFSPHMKIAYGSALPVGVGSDCEYFDIFLSYEMDAKEALDLLQRFSAKDLYPFSAEYISTSLPSASVAFPTAVYEVELSEALGDFTIPEEIKVVRKKKEKTLRVLDFLSEDITVSKNRLMCTLKSSNDGSLRIDLLVSEILKSHPGVQISSITRKRQM